MRVKSPRIAQVVVVGAGFGGLRVARNLAGAPVRITVVDRSNYHLFQPLLYQVATASLSPADIATPIRSVLREQKNTEVLMAEVTGVDREHHEVITDQGRLPYDYLVLATGARHGYFGHEDWENNAPGIKTIPDATTIRQKILMAFEAAEMEPDAVRRKKLLTFVLVGGGPTGVEMAGAIAELSHRALALDFRRIDPKSSQVILLEAGPTILASFPRPLAERGKAELERLGVDVRTESRVESVSAEGVLVNGKMIYSPNVIWAAGVVASPVGKWLGAETDRAGRVKVLPDLSVAGSPEIFVIGDAAYVEGEDGKPLPGVAPVAMQQGKYVAATIEERMEGDTSTPPFHYWNKGNLATVGRGFAVADFGKFQISGFIAWVLWLVVHIYYLIGFRNRLLVLAQWAWAYLTFQRGARLITDMKLRESIHGGEKLNVPEA
jgi:NADH dehydrogenase